MKKTLNYFLSNGTLPGKVCCVYKFGNSGSYLFQSLFENFNHPEVLTVGFSSLIYFKESITKVYLDDLNNKRDSKSSLKILNFFPHLFCQPKLGPNQKIVNKKKFVNIFINMVTKFNGKINHESLLKIIFLSFRFTQKNNITNFNNLVYLWQIHYQKNNKDKIWLEKNFKDLLIFIIVRFPEKSIDSHLIHHLFENITKPFSNLFNLLFYKKMLSDGLKVCSSNIEFAIRFEDMHNHTDKLLKIVCEKLGIKFYKEMINSKFIYNFSGSKVYGLRKINGLRKIKHKDLTPKILNFFDCVKVRNIMENYYTKWNYQQIKNEIFKEESKTEVIITNNLKFSIIDLLKNLELNEKIKVTKKEIEFEQKMNAKFEMDTDYESIKQRIYDAKFKIREDLINLNLKNSNKLLKIQKKNKANLKQIVPLLYDSSKFFIFNEIT